MGLHGKPTTGLPAFATTEVEAQKRFEAWRSVDPFRDIAPALLNSADLLDYVAKVGMLYPYEVKPAEKDDWVKPASCAVPCTGEFLRFNLDEGSLTHKREPERGVLTESSRLQLPRNSITFLHLGTTFQIPDYMAARFNLTIREIHRGILVGTGPLVDPGFVGRLFIPLHNLTSNNYTIAYGEPLVWIEFTKLSPTPAWGTRRPQRREAQFIPFPKRKNERKTPEAYLDHANHGDPIASSIPREIARATTRAEEAKRGVTNLRRAGIAGIAIAALAAIWPIASLISDTNSRIDQTNAARTQLETTVTTLQDVVDRQSSSIAALRAQIVTLRRQAARRKR
jgi:deoxycytidine triphosphate deaminase